MNENRWLVTFSDKSFNRDQFVDLFIDDKMFIMIIEKLKTSYFSIGNQHLEFPSMDGIQININMLNIHSLHFRSAKDSIDLIKTKHPTISLFFSECSTCNRVSIFENFDRSRKNNYTDLPVCEKCSRILKYQKELDEIESLTRRLKYVSSNKIPRKRRER